MYVCIFYVHWCFACEYTHVRVSDSGVMDSLEATMCVLGIKPGSCGRRIGVLNGRVTVPALMLYFLKS